MARAETLFHVAWNAWRRFDLRPAPRLPFAIALLCISGTAAFIGAVHTKIFGHDIFFLLDNGWRAIHGQRPHTDYHSAWGPVMFLVAAFGLRLSHYGVEGIGYGNAIVSLGIGAWCFALGRGRLGSFGRILLSLFLAALVASPYPLGLSPFDSSHAMVYNRYGYALLGLVLLECWESLREGSPKTSEWAGGISTGAALALALFLKASYFVIGVPLLLLSLVALRSSRRVIGIVLGFLAVSLALLTYLHFDLPAMLRDLSMAAGARSQSLHPSDLVWQALNHASAALAVMLVGFVASLSLGGGLRLVFAGLVLFASDIVLLSSNAQGSALPLIGIFALLVANDLFQPQQASATPGSVALCVILFVPQFTADLSGLAYGALRKVQPATPAAAARLAPLRLRSLILYDGQPPESNGHALAAYVNDGVALLQRATAPTETVLTMDMTNPFPYALDRMPPHGGLAAATYRNTFSDRYRPSDDEYFGDAAIVMVPKKPAEDAAFFQALYRLYEPGLKQRFRLSAETDRWQLYRRKADQPRL